MKGWLALMLLLAASLPASAQAPPLTPSDIKAILEAGPIGADAQGSARRIRESFGAEELVRGPRPRVDGLTVAWALEVAESSVKPEIVSQDGAWRLPMRRVGETPVYAAVTTLPEGWASRWQYAIGERRLGGGQLEVYPIDPDTVARDGVPRGTVREMGSWESKVFTGTRRNWWVYVPAQYVREKPACVMVFQDGAGARNYIPTVFDNLIAKGEMPVTVGVFLDPGVYADGQRTRSMEYDTLSDRYARFLLEEILPEVEKSWNLRRDAAGRAIGGISSGGICAFTVAWERPDAFSKVLSWVGSFVNIASGPTRREGGHNYPALIRKTPRKPIRVFLQGGANDLDNEHGNWPLANHEMARALAFAGYDHRFVFGNGFHSDRHGRAILPDSLRWLWRDVR
jgi:enterochelin esterase family protein